MFRHRMIALLLGLPGLGLLLLTLPAEEIAAATPKEERDAFFNPGKVIELFFEIGSKEMESLRREPRKYVKANLRCEGIVLNEIAVHLKGAAGSFRGVDDKPGLTINVDKFVDGQKFFGMEKFHLSNSVQDPSYLNEYICAEMFRKAGVPASRIGHAVVSINGKRRGLYYLKEGYDKHFLKESYGNSNGNFYDGGFLRDIDQPLEVNPGKGDVQNHGDLKALLEASREGDPQKRFKRMEALLDMDRFITYLALETMCWDWDGYPMNRNNYRIYHDTARNKLIFIPSGMDQMFHDPNGPLFPGFQGHVARAVMETPEGKEKYIARMKELFTTVYKTADLHKRIDEAAARIQAALAKFDQGASRDHPNHVKSFKDRIEQREKKLTKELQNYTK